MNEPHAGTTKQSWLVNTNNIESWDFDASDAISTDRGDWQAQ